MIAESSEIKFECSRCGQSIAVDSAAAGLTAHCPTCDSPLVVPTLQALHDREYGERAPSGKQRHAFVDDEAQELRDELAEARRRGDESERALKAARKEIARVEERLQQAIAERDQRDAGAKSAQTEVQDLQAERLALQSELAQSLQRATTAESQLTEARGVISQLGATLESVEENRAQWEHAFGQAAERATAGETQLAARDAELGAALAAARGEIEVLHREADELREQLLCAQGELRDAGAAAQEKLAATQLLLESGEADRQALSERAEALRKESEMLRRDLSEIDSGRELLTLRERFLAVETEHQRATATLARVAAELQAVSAAEAKLRAELAETRTRAGTAEHRADATSESALSKDNEVLRGIIARQNAVQEVHVTELKRLRRARLASRILYALIVLALIGLVAFAIDCLPAAAKTFVHEWFGL